MSQNQLLSKVVVPRGGTSQASPISNLNWLTTAKSMTKGKRLFGLVTNLGLRKGGRTVAEIVLSVELESRYGNRTSRADRGAAAARGNIGGAESPGPEAGAEPAGVPGVALGRWRLEQRTRLNQTAAERAYSAYAASFRERKRSWKNLVLPLDLPPQRNDPDVTVKGAVRRPQSAHTALTRLPSENGKNPEINDIGHNDLKVGFESHEVPAIRRTSSMTDAA